MQVITVATLDTMPQARALARSLARHEPDWPLDVLLVAGEEIVSAAQGRESVRVRSAAAELDLDVETLLARYDRADLGVLLTPRLLARYLQASGAPVLHLASSVWVLGTLEPIEQALSAGGVVLAPRMNGDVPRDGLEPSQAQMERAGRIDDATMAVAPTPRADGFLTWWIGHVERMLGSPDASETGARPEDRGWLARFLELAPARFSTAVLDDPGCNLSMWNLHDHTLAGSPDGVLVDGRWPLRFLNLAGYDPARPHRLNAMASRARVSRSPVLHELSERYARELREAGWRDLDHRDDVGRRLANGLVYDDSLRATYGSALALGEAPEDVFSQEGTRAFVAWLQSPAPAGGAFGVNRYVFHRVARDRPDAMRAYPDLDGADGPGFVAWCWAFGREELSIPEQLMPPRSGARAPAAGAPAATQIAAGSVVSAPGTDAVTPAANLPAAASSAVARSGASAAPAGGDASAEAVAPDGDAPVVRVTGYLGHTLGLGAAARGYVRALGAARVQVTTATVPLHHLELPVKLAAEYGRHGFEDLVHEGRHGFEIVAVNADELPDLVARLGEDYFEGPRIGIWGWETNAIPRRWQRAFALVDEIWVYSRFMAENIGAAASVPVVALPPPVAVPREPAEPQRLGIPDGFTFLFVFDYLSTIQRKNPVGLIEAFRRAFEPGEGPQLLIKTINGPLRPLAEEEVLWAAHGRPDVHLVDRSLSPHELDGLMAGCDCYVSLHRAEGFGLTIAEAMAIGKPVIATGYSGNVDFMDADNSYLVDYEISRVGPDCEIYPPEGEWADPSVEHAATLMRHVYEDPAAAAAVGDRARREIARTLSPEATGGAMRRRLQELAANGVR
jgi:glycosyltransferase involved in cell wall biosynthesis